MLLPAGPSHPSYKQDAPGVDSGTRLGVAVATLARRESSAFVAAVLTMLACTGYGGEAIVDALKTSPTCRKNGRYLRHSRTHAAALGQMVAADANARHAMHAVFLLIKGGAVVGPCVLLPKARPSVVWTKRKPLHLLGIRPELAAILARRFAKPIVDAKRRTIMVTLAACLVRCGIPLELASIVISTMPMTPPACHAMTVMPKIALRGIDY